MEQTTGGRDCQDQAAPKDNTLSIWRNTQITFRTIAQCDKDYNLVKFLINKNHRCWNPEGTINLSNDSG